MSIKTQISMIGIIWQLDTIFSNALYNVNGCQIIDMLLVRGPSVDKIFILFVRHPNAYAIVTKSDLEIVVLNWTLLNNLIEL